ncbi:MAG: ATP-dependent DNA helicase [Pseudomonadota bacterium]|nr:ATP-dependent DNA helicase [Pseudomonadota bacterium]
MSTDWRYFFSAEGPLAASFNQFRPRPAQLEMVQAVSQAIDEQTHLVCEAPTGTGKTLAYLLPAIDSEKRTIISTGTKHLQQQLYHNDLSVAKRALGKHPKHALLKGRSNYLCQYRIERFEYESLQLPSRQAFSDFKRIRTWSLETGTGDIAELDNVSEQSAAWSYATSTVDNCLGSDCDQFETCFVYAARKRAMEADIVVVNHHLLFSDFLLKEEGFGSLLPNMETVIIDEAHQLPDTARLFFGQQFSSRQVHNLIADIQMEQSQVATDDIELMSLSNQLKSQIDTARSSFGDSQRRAEWRQEDRATQPIFESISHTLAELEERFEEARVRSEGLEKCAERTQRMADALKKVLPDQDEGALYWNETFSKSFMLHRTPMDVGEPFAQMMQSHGSSWIFTSATLATHKNTHYFSQELGLQQTDKMTSLVLESPFDFQKQALLINPRGLPQPSAKHYNDEFKKIVAQVVKRTQGRCFVLCTAHRVLKDIATELRRMPWLTVFVQGESSKEQLLKDFRQQQPAVLVGTASFWEGVDVVGDDLRCVIIDRLPFASPDDPMVKARDTWLKRQGKSTFWEFSIPQAVIRLKQGVGRLIRSHDDSGVVIIADPRLCQKSYGQTFLMSLPDMQRSRDLAKLADFFSEHDELEREHESPSTR